MAEKDINRRKIFLIHGRNRAAHDAMIAFLKAMDLVPIDFDIAKRSIKKHPFSISDVLDYAFENAWAVMVLITGDDEGRLIKCHWKESEEESEKNLKPQPRLNVVFEAGLAFARYPERTVLVKIGEAKDFSDLAGKYIHSCQGTKEDRVTLKDFLKNIGCAVEENSLEWLTAGDFSASYYQMDSQIDTLHEASQEESNNLEVEQDTSRPGEESTDSRSLAVGPEEIANKKKHLSEIEFDEYFKSFNGHIVTWDGRIATVSLKKGGKEARIQIEFCNGSLRGFFDVRISDYPNVKLFRSGDMAVVTGEIQNTNWPCFDLVNAKILSWTKKEA